MSTVAATAREQAQANELPEAKALIEAGEYGAALDALTRISDAARTGHGAAGLNEVRLLAECVSARALRRNDRERADALRLGVADEADAAAASASQLRRALRLWALLVVMVWLVVSVFLAALVAATSNPDGFFSPGFYAAAVVVVLTAIALVVWLVGVLTILLDHHVPVGSLVRRGWLGRWSVLVVFGWVVLALVSARGDLAASWAGWALILLGLYGPVALVVWLLGVLVHRVLVGRRRPLGRSE